MKALTIFHGSAFLSNVSPLFPLNKHDDIGIMVKNESFKFSSILNIGVPNRLWKESDDFGASVLYWLFLSY